MAVVKRDERFTDGDNVIKQTLNLARTRNRLTGTGYVEGRDDHRVCFNHVTTSIIIPNPSLKQTDSMSIFVKENLMRL